MGLFNKPQTQDNMSEKQKLTNKYNTSRNNILLIVVFTLINSVLLFTGSDSYFLFSAAIPYYMTLFGLLYTGRMPAEWYEGVEEFIPDPDSVLVFYLGIAIIALVLYALAWLLSKKKGYGWLIVALIMFVIDTAAMFYFTGFSADMILDIVFHAWVIISLISGIITAKKLKKLPEEEPTVAPQYSYDPQNVQIYNNQPVQNDAPTVDAPVTDEAVTIENVPAQSETNYIAEQAPATEDFTDVNDFAPAEMPEAPEETSY